MVAGAFGSCIDLHATWTKGFDANNCPIVTFSSNKEGLEDCDVAVGPYLKTVTVNGNEMNVSDLLADINFEYVPYDQATHVPGPLLGTGTPADPFQVPVKECNFVFVDYDPDEHIEGQPVEGSGTAVDPWQIPVKQCNFEYVPYEPVIHDEGVIEGDGTEDSPWQIPFKECNFNYVPYDPEIHDYDDPIEGDGTAEDPWQIPVKECNFEYVAYNPTVHTFGNIAGDGTAADPWQIPLFELDSDVKICAVRIVNTPVGGQNVYSFEYDLCDKDDNVVDTLVAANVPVPTFSDKQGNPLVGDIELLVPSDFVDRGNNYYEAAGLQGINSAGECELFSPPTWAYVPYDPDTHSGPLQGVGTDVDPFEIPVTPEKECNFEYVPFDETVHNAGPIEGDGTEDSPWQVPLEPPKECNFTYVDFDPTIHGETDSGDSAIAGDGTAANPWQIPRPCCEVVVPQCEDVKITGETTQVTLEGCVPEVTTLDITAASVDRGYEGYALLRGDSLVPDLVAGTLTVPVPPCNPGEVLILHTASGSDDTGGAGVSRLGDIQVSAASPTGIVSAATLLESNLSQFDWGHHIWAFDALAAGGGATVTLSAPSATTTEGVINWHWSKVSASNGPVTVADLDLANSVAATVEGFTADVGAPSQEFMSLPNCPALVYSSGRHTLHPGLVQFQFKEIVDSDWLQYSAGTELYDTSSQDHNATADPCQIGMGLAFIPAGTTFTVDHVHNISSGTGEGSRDFVLPISCETVVCEPAGQVPDPDVFDIASPECSRSGEKVLTVSGVSVTAGAGDIVQVVAVIDGADDANPIVVDNSAGASPLTETGDFNITTQLATLPVDGTGSCSITFRLDVVSGTGEGATATVPAGDVCITLTEA